MSKAKDASITEARTGLPPDAPGRSAPPDNPGHPVTPGRPVDPGPPVDPAPVNSVIVEQREKGDSFRKEVEDAQAVFKEDRRGGMFFFLGGKRTHESDLTPQQREELKLPPITGETTNV